MDLGVEGRSVGIGRHRPLSLTVQETNPADKVSLSVIEVPLTATATSTPRVSVLANVLGPEISWTASYPLLWPVTVDAPRTARASAMPADGAAR